MDSWPDWLYWLVVGCGSGVAGIVGGWLAYLFPFLSLPLVIVSLCFIWRRYLLIGHD